MKKRFVSALVLFLLSSFYATASPKRQFVWLSDIHFDPLVEPAMLNRLAAAEPAQWEGIFATWSKHQFATFGEDTNWTLFASALQDIKRTVPRAEFTIVTGDLLAHHFRERFNKVAAIHDDTAFHSFLNKTMQFVGMQLQKIAPGKPVFVTLGNNDADCGDYQLQPNGPFLQGSQALIAGLLQQGNESDLSDWPRLGVYSVPHPTLQHYRIIAINTALLSARYRNACGNSGDSDPGATLIAWLEEELAKAQRLGEKAWLIYHIPPGIDGFATFRHNNVPTPFWKPEFAKKFDTLLARYDKTIAGNFAGHTHADDFRLIGTPGGPRSVVFMTPGLSPIVNQNPAFRVVQFRSNGDLTDQATYYLNPDAPAWKLEYRFSQAWGFRQLNYKNFENLYEKIDKSPETRERWTTFYSVSHPEGGSITSQTYWALHCASGHTEISSYQACLSAGPHSSKSQ